MARETSDVLVVGAGPVGLTLGAMLAYQGVRFRIVDKAPTACDKSRALAIWSRSLELLDKVGLAQRLDAAGLHGHGASIYANGKRIAHVSLDGIDSPYPWVLLLPQCDTERILNEHLAQIGQAVERQVELMEFKDDGQGVECVLRQPDGREERLRVSYLAGCDGAHSTVRHRLGMEFEGNTLESGWALGDLFVDNGPADDEVSIFWDKDGIVAVFPMGGGSGPNSNVGRFRILVDWPSKIHSDGAPTLEEMQSLMDKRVMRGWKLRDPQWLTFFTINERKVRDYSQGRVFLCGDAAHIHSPAGGQGMNTGMQDAVNLSWKLGLVLNGQGSAALLDSYSLERTEIGEQIVRNADRMTTMATLRGPVKQELRNHIMSVISNLGIVQQKITSQLSELAIGYPKSPVVGEHSGALAWTLSHGVRPGERVPDAALVDVASQAQMSLFDVLKSPRHVALLLCGLHPSERDTQALLDVARMLGERYEPQIECVMISAAPVPGWSGRACLDREATVHRMFGAGHASLYIVRPDGYVGFRSQPPDRASLEQWLGKVFVASAAGVSAR